ncbi:hypothetical protein AB0L59_26630 [Streptomyces sp. NPDC052109]|uniref:hypothetical protein n=1 Tax=Streptomyces sp. NPDC052109 TaxID=3155527 RepID=UPI003434A9F0
MERPLKEGAFFDAAETVPLDGVAPEQWRAAVVDDKGQVERIPYELCVLVALRDTLRRREIWVVGANRWRNPEDDLPQDFEDNRDVHYDAIRQPQDPAKFVTDLQKKLCDSLDRFEAALMEGTTGGVAIVKKHSEPWIKVSPRPRQEEPENLVAVKSEIERRWGTNGAGALLNASEELLKRDDKVAAKLLEQSPFTPGTGSQPAGPDCSPRASHNAEDLPNVVGETSGIDQYLFNERFLGQPDKLRAVATTWRSAAKILHDTYWDSRDAWKTATLDQAGHTADAGESFFEKFAGKTPPLSEVGDHDTLLANLPTACTMLANTCDAYADHVETAQKTPSYGEHRTRR